MKPKEETKVKVPILKEVSERKVFEIRDRLTIIVREIASEQRSTLCGRPSDYSVAEVLSNWYSSKRREPVGPRVVDLVDVSAIDRSGERGLSMMIGDRARFGGIYAKYFHTALQKSVESKSRLNSIQARPMQGRRFVLQFR
jgi:hypothetical protein